MRGLIAIGAALTALLVSAATAGSASLPDWSAYLNGPSHTSLTAADTITPANVGSLHLAWHFKPPVSTMPGQPPPQIFASPTVVGNRVYVGFNNGVFYALDADTGHVVWQRFMGYVTQMTCTARGFTSTATVQPDPVSGVLTVYVNAGDGFLYALRASDGAVMWRSLVALNMADVNGYYNWTSPAIVDGRVYVGLSSECDNPFVRGGVKSYDQHTGAHLATHWTAPPSLVGAGVWSSPAATSDGQVYVTTGSTTPPPYPQSESYSILRLNGATLAEEGIWTVPAGDLGSDSDFGASPTVFTATINNVSTRLISACNKNGRLYAMKADDIAAGPVWAAKINTSKVGPCFASTIFDGSSLYQAGNKTSINKTVYAGSISKLDPATGAFVWRTGIPGSVFGSPALNGAGVIAVPTFDDASAANGTYFVSADTGAILAHISLANAKQFGQPIFAGKYLLLAQINQGVNAYTP